MIIHKPVLGIDYLYCFPKTMPSDNEVVSINVVITQMNEYQNCHMAKSSKKIYVVNPRMIHDIFEVTLFVKMD